MNREERKTLMDLKEPILDIYGLISLCCDEKTKPYLVEAIACYKAKAFRAAIVATWIAVVFDLIAKLHELKTMGDDDASKCLARFSRFQHETDPKNVIPLAQEIEQTILDVVKDSPFELLSFLEYKDLLRLHEDRHRCAHPSMHSLEEPYQPTEELVLYHLRNAVTFVLQQPPVQGRKAEEAIWEDIHSRYFPTTIQDAIPHLKSGPFARVHTPLLRRVIVGLTKSLLKDQLSHIERQRQFAALGAALQIYAPLSDEILHNELSTIVGKVSDEAWPAVIVYISIIPSVWDALDETRKKKAFRFMKFCPSEILPQIITEALIIPALKEIAEKRLQDISLESLPALLAQDETPELLNEAFQRWGKAESYDDAKMMTKKLIIPLLPRMNAKHIAQIVEMFIVNSQLYGCFLARDMMLDLFRHSLQFAAETKNTWLQFYGHYTCLKNDMLEKIDFPSLLSLIEDAYPDIVDLVTEQARKREAQFLRDSATEDEEFGGL